MVDEMTSSQEETVTGETAEAPSYSDKQVESGKQYRYAVSAFDKTGNESKRSDEIAVAAP